VSQVAYVVKKRCSHERHIKIGFLALKEIESGTVFSTVSEQLEKPNHHKGVPK